MKPGADRGQRPLSVPGARRRARAWATTSRSSPSRTKRSRSSNRPRRAPPAASVHWISIGQLGKCIKLLKEAGVTQAVMAGQVKHTKIFGGIVPTSRRCRPAHAAEVAQHRRDHRRRRRRAARPRHRADRFDGVARAAAGEGRRLTRRAPTDARSRPTSSSATAWPTRLPASTSARRSPSSTRRWSPSKRWKGPTRSSPGPVTWPARACAS